MTIKLPPMQLLAKRWNLPQHIIAEANYYQLDKVTWEQAKLLQTVGTIHRDKLVFEVISLKDLDLHKACPEVWVSYRSLTFEFKGEQQTYSFALLQPAFSQRAKVTKPKSATPLVETKRSRFPSFRTFADLSQPKELDS